MNNNRKLKIKKMMKKGATISLCAVLAGGIGVGAYEGVDFLQEHSLYRQLQIVPRS